MNAAAFSAARARPRVALEVAKRKGRRKPSDDRTDRPGELPSVFERLGPDGIAQLLTEYEAGEPCTALSKRYCIAKPTVLRLLRKHDVSMRGQPMTPEDAAEAITLYKQGWSLARIGRHFGRQHTVIRDILVRADIPRRDSHGRDRP